MLIGVVKEIKKNENRVALTPWGAAELKKHGHSITIEKDGGVGSGFSNESYEKVGVEIVETAKEVWDRGEMIMKVKEPIAPERPMMREGQLVFTYFHFAADRPLTEEVMASKCIAVAYETVEKVDRSLPLLVPMSEVAGRMAVQQGAKYLEKAQGGRGILLSGIPGVKPAEVLVLGGGVVGINSAKVAAGMGANVTIMDIDLNRMRYLDDVMAANVTTVMSSEGAIREHLPLVDLVVGGVLIPGYKAPCLISREMLKLMKKGSVIVDVAVDQGGCIETIKPTTHADPIYVVDDVVHYGVANMPGAVPFTSTIGLTNATLPYAIELANKGWVTALKENRELELGLNMAYGEITYAGVAEAFGFDCKPSSDVLANA